MSIKSRNEYMFKLNFSKMKLIEKQKPLTLLTVGYLLALTLIGGMSIGAHIVASKVIEVEQNSARIVNIAGRQRMLSQRTALFMFRYMESGDEKIKATLKENIDLFEKSHRALVNGNKEMGIPETMPQSLKEIYFNPPYNLNQQALDYIADVKTLLSSDTREDSNTRNAIYERAYKQAEGNLLTTLDLAVKAYQQDSEIKMSELSDIQEKSLLILLLVIILEIQLIFKPLVNMVQKYSQQIEKIAAQDMLTGILNRWAFYNRASTELNRSKRHERPTSLILCDLDHFKSVNDNYGHNIGDDALKHFTKIASKSIRKEDIIGRTGGEEFAVLLPETDIEQSKFVAEKIRSALENTHMSIKSKETEEKLKLTTSMGITEYKPSLNENIDDIFARADKALYAAKKNGRNRFETL